MKTPMVDDHLRMTECTEKRAGVIVNAHQKAHIFLPCCSVNRVNMHDIRNGILLRNE